MIKDDIEAPEHCGQADIRSRLRHLFSEDRNAGDFVSGRALSYVRVPERGSSFTQRDCPVPSRPAAEPASTVAQVESRVAKLLCFGASYRVDGRLLLSVSGARSSRGNKTAAMSS